MSIGWIILLPLCGALAAPLVAGRTRAASAWAAAAATATALAVALSHAPAVFAGETVQLLYPWIPAIGLDLALRLDGLAFVFVLLVLAIGLLVILYASYYLPAEDPKGRFFALLLLFQTAMLGIVMADNLLMLLVFWELTSLTSFLLVGYDPSKQAARRGARIALVITGAGGLALLAGLLLLGHVVGSYRLSDVLAAGDLVRGHDLYVPILVLILLGVFTKSAQFPFHFWLPGAMAAPTPVSAYLHSATMVKAGVFLLARFHPTLAGTEVWFYLVGGVGLATLLFGAYTALFKHDLKGLLAYSTISHLGLITFLFGLGTPLGAVAGLFHIINHAIFKGSLFMAAGIIDHETGTRDMRRINGLWKYMPYTATLAMVAASAMAGVPLLNGFLSKEMFFDQTLDLDLLGGVAWLLPAAATLAGTFAVAYSLRFIHDVFFNGEPVDLPRTPHEPPRWMRIPVEILVALCLLVGILPQQTVGPFLEIGASGMLGSPPSFDLAIWHGFNAPLVMSLIALGAGVLVYSSRHWLFATHDRLLPRTSGEAAFERIAALLLHVSHRIMAWIDNRSLQRYAVWLVLVVLVLTAAPLVRHGLTLDGGLAGEPVDGVSLVAALLVAAAAVATVVAARRQRLLALIMTSIVGLVVSLTFIHFSAPDLALTQLSVEVVTTILLLLVLYLLPLGEIRPTPRWRQIRDLVLASAAGLGTAALAYAMMTRGYEPISRYFLEFAKPHGGGTNVVNVILVDFRGFDTWGEITVLGIAATGIYAMLRGLRLKAPTRGTGGRPWSADAHPLILAMISRPLLPLALLVSVYILLRGHNSPGGGFIAGLVAGTALILQQLASGQQWTGERMRLGYFTLIGVGLAVATGTGLAALIFERPFLTSAYTYLSLPLVGKVEVASAMAFDLGVFLVVVGTVMLILENLGRLTSGRTQTAPVSPGEER